jgi:hypothetical protein
VFAISEAFVHVHRFSVVGDGEPELVVQLHVSVAPMKVQPVQEETYEPPGAPQQVSTPFEFEICVTTGQVQRSSDAEDEDPESFVQLQVSTVPVTVQSVHVAE